MDGQVAPHRAESRHAPDSGPGSRPGSGPGSRHVASGRSRARSWPREITNPVRLVIVRDRPLSRPQAMVSVRNGGRPGLPASGRAAPMVDADDVLRCAPCGNDLRVWAAPGMLTSRPSVRLTRRRSPSTAGRPAASRSSTSRPATSHPRRASTRASSGRSMRSPAATPWVWAPPNASLCTSPSPPWRFGATPGMVCG